MKTPHIEEQWQNKFLNKGTELGCGDLSLMIGTVSEILAKAKEEALQERDRIASENASMHKAEEIWQNFLNHILKDDDGKMPTFTSGQWSYLKKVLYPLTHENVRDFIPQTTVDK